VTVSVGLSVCVYVLCVHAQKEKPIELLIPNLVDIEGMSLAWHALILRSKGQTLKLHGYQMHCWQGYACRYDCLGFTSFYRTMHYSAKHGLAIAYCLSVSPSVCDVGGS